MERERYLEMMENLGRLADEGVLGVSGDPGATGVSAASVFHFAHCGATMELADELLKMGIKPVAILDNNPDKYGLDYKGIPVCAPSETVRDVDSAVFTNAGKPVNAELSDGSARQEDAVILIVSRFYEQMASQMRGLGFEGRIEKLTDYNTYAEYSLSPDTLIRKSERLKDGIEKLRELKSVYPGHFIVFCPFPALGDIYFCMSYLKPYLDVIGRDECLVCVVGNAQRQVAELFDYGENLKLDVPRLDQKEMDKAIQAVIYTDDPDCYIAHQDRPYVVDLQRALYKKCIPLETIYKCGIFGLPQETEAVKPIKWKQFVFSEDANGGKTAIISPYAKSVASLPESLWIDIVDDLSAQGYELYTNVCGDERALPGTRPISPTIAEMRSAVEQAGLFIGIRSGMCDVIKTAHCRKIALYPDYFYCDTKWKSIDMYAIDGFENIVVKDKDTWEEVKKQIKTI